MPSALGATPAECDELLRYNENHFDPDGLGRVGSLPLADEAFVKTWERYAREAESVGAWPVLRRALVQLRFPVRRGMSREPAYEAATRGLASLQDESPALELSRPDAVRIEIHDTPAGRLPVVVASRRGDFERLVQALTKRNEPAPVPASIGACMVAGYTNVGRLRTLREQWWAGHPFPTEAGWKRELRMLLPRKALYQDRFIIASTTPYSAVPADRLGLARRDVGADVARNPGGARVHALLHAPRVRLDEEPAARRDHRGLCGDRACGRPVPGRLGAQVSRPRVVPALPRRAGAWSTTAAIRRSPTGPSVSCTDLVKRAVDNLESWSATADDATRPDGHIGTVLALTRLTVEELAAGRRPGSPACGWAGRRPALARKRRSPCTRDRPIDTRDCAPV